MPESTQVRNLFSGIAPRYDLANRILSFGMDMLWRRELVRRARALHPNRVLDMATGSGDVAFALRRALPSWTGVTGMDFCPEMLEIALQRLEKLRQKGKGMGLAFFPGDCLNIPMETYSVNLVTIAFGLRNLEDRRQGLREMLRVLRHGGYLLVMEFSQPKEGLRPFHNFYVQKVLPRLAGLLTGQAGAYRYLGESIASFPDCQGLGQEILEAGFESVTATQLCGGTVAIHQARKGY